MTVCTGLKPATAVIRAVISDVGGRGGIGRCSQLCMIHCSAWLHSLLSLETERK